LLRVPLFAGLKPLQLTELARQAERVKFQRGDVITKAGEPGDGAYLIVSGLAEHVEPPDLEAAAGTHRAGSLIGEMAMLVEHDNALDSLRAMRALLKITRAGARADAGGRRAYRAFRARHCRAAVAEARAARIEDSSAASLDAATTSRRIRRQRSPGSLRSPPGAGHKRKAPNPGGGVGRKKRVMRRCREGSRHRKQMSSARRGALPMKSDIARYNHK
jgi:CRP-like cAMP-binding protein